MNFKYKGLNRRQALINVISDNLEKNPHIIDIYDLAKDIENYIKKTHKRK